MVIKITLRAARVNAGYNQLEAANRFGINIDTLSKYERNSTDIPRSIMMKVEDIYKIPLDYIFFGVESDFFRTTA